MAIKIIVGLGNPGKEYEQTRHNAGAQFIEYLAQRSGQQLKPEKKFHGMYAKISVANSDLHLINPTTYMNRSGLSVQAIASFFKILPEEILVAHDELDLPCGKVKLKLGGGHGGHNGLRDIIKALGGNNFYRLRLGIDHPGSKEQVVGYVLGKTDKGQMQLLESTFDECERSLDFLTSGEIAKAMNRINSFAGQ
ncbi:MAG: aminoacyl-tRNA hydrolase [Hahellaceae bacterium]|nr:aminoacyl-tRNA hydrolase [Hahellaceae bacterium]MCP5212444.1 aminoacyl-tRNA hydrolase [Hahellaceae bacterium]